MPGAMRIHIPSRGRAKKQITLFQLPREWLFMTTVWVYEEEFEEYVTELKDMIKKQGITVQARPKELKGLSPLRQWLLRNETAPRMLILDDDLTFSKRTPENKLVPARYQDVAFMLQFIEHSIWPEWPDPKHPNKDVALVSVSSRYMLNGKKRGYEDNKRTNCVTGINVKLVRDVIEARYDRVPLAGDADLTLQVLLAGYKTRVSTEWAYSQPAGADGGVSSYRTIKMMEEVYKKLAEMHPGIVSLFQHKTKHKFQGESNVRTDIKVAWKKAADVGFLRRRRAKS